MTQVADCYSCARDAEFDRLPPRERIGADDLWRVAHAFNVALPGWLVLLPRRHVTAIADLTDAEASSLGTWQVRLSRALHAVLDCQKTYVAQFAEAEGFAHVHFHIVPRPADLSGDWRGPGIFGLLGPAARPHVDARAMDEIAVKLTAELKRTAVPSDNR
jgi:diadenosine tetraphosphate (Ap4A) HIT family hydrolase